MGNRGGRGLNKSEDINRKFIDYSSLEELLGYRFSNKGLLETALTHTTYAYEHRPGVEHNERLEFVGDGILDFVIADVLYNRKSKRDEGYLSKTRALIVCETTLAAEARILGIGDYLRLGKGEAGTSGRDKASNLANAMEAIFAAVYLDGGFSAAREVILTLLHDSIETALSGKIIFDYKSKILELAQLKGDTHQIEFLIVEESGPVHDRSYTAALMLDDRELSRGVGQSKKLAEQAAAKAGYREWTNRLS